MVLYMYASADGPLKLILSQTYNQQQGRHGTFLLSASPTKYEDSHVMHAEEGKDWPVNGRRIERSRALSSRRQVEHLHGVQFVHM